MFVSSLLCILNIKFVKKWALNHHKDIDKLNTVDTGYNVLSGDQKIWYVITEVRYKHYFQ